MANIVIKDAAGNSQEVKATGAGTAVDPFVIQRSMVGLVAHDDAQIAGNNPVIQGAIARNAAPAAVGNGDVSNLIATLGGALIVQPGASHEWEDVNSVLINSGTEMVLVAAVASVRHVMQTLIIGSEHGYPISVEIRDATAGSIRMLYRIPANTTGFYNMPDGWAARGVNANWTAKVVGATTTYPTFVYCKSYRRSY